MIVVLLVFIGFFILTCKKTDEYHKNILRSPLTNLEFERKLKLWWGLSLVNIIIILTLAVVVFSV